MKTELSTKPSTPLPMVSLREQSTSTIAAAIHSPPDNGETLRRVNACLAQFFEPDHDPQTKADVRQSFVRALAHLPVWAMHKAFDWWERSSTRRPSPAEIVILAERELKPLAEELGRRKADEARAEAERQDAAKQRVTPEQRERIMAEAGFRPKQFGGAA